ncbi:MAG: response regulator [Verrucomicrobiota bacterium]|nr:response regulator [Verrucomicrobiota bacterium]
MANILIAEDEGAVRTFLTRAMQSQGHDVKAVADGVQALHALQKGKFDLLLSDIVMPELDGISLALRVSRDWPDMPIILITGFAKERQRAHNLEALVHCVVPKPFDLETICGIVAEALEAG